MVDCAAGSILFETYPGYLPANSSAVNKEGHINPVTLRNERETKRDTYCYGNTTTLNLLTTY